MEKTNNILYVMAYKNFQDEEYFETKKIFENNGYKTKISSSIIGEGQGKLGSSVNIELLFSEVDAINFDAIVFIGGLDASHYGTTGERRDFQNYFWKIKKLSRESEAES